VPDDKHEIDGGVDALTADGGIVRIRPVRPADERSLLTLYGRASDQSLYRRFFTGGRQGILADVARMIRTDGTGRSDGLNLPDGTRHVALLAEHRGEALGVATYEQTKLPGQAEFAVLVDDANHGRGIGTLLLEHLAATARRNGITELIGEVLAGNTPMLTMAADLNPGLRKEWDSGVVQVRFATGVADTAAMDARDRQAERLSLAPLLTPHAVAVVGAGRNPGGIGHEVLLGLRDGRFTGSLYAVNPYAPEVAGVPAYPSVADLPTPVDLAVVAVPAPAVAGVLAECGAAGVRAAVVLSSGFGEEGPAGRAAQADLVRIARANGIRLVGPNCLGVLNTDPAVRLHATFAEVTPPAGGLAVASQSGAVAITILDHAARTGTGLSTFVSLGNKADVSGNDLLSYWYDDPGTRAVALYLESVGNPRRFARIARALARRKPVLAVKSGRTVSGSRAGASHTAAAAAPDVTVDTLFTQAGVIRCDTLGELLDTARLLVDQPLPAGNRLAIVGNAGGVNVLAAAAADAAGLSVPELSDAVQATIGAAGGAALANPIDLGAATTPHAIGTAIRAVAASGEVDALLVVFAATRANDVPGVVAAIAGAADAAHLPVAAVLLGLPQPPNVLGERRTPVYPLPEQAVTALARAARYAAWRETPLGTVPDLSDVDSSAARTMVAGALVEGGGWQSPESAAALLRCYRIPVLDGTVVRDADAAVAAAQVHGYPVALKAADPALVHKSDVGGVRLGLANADAVRAGYAAIAVALGVTAPAVLVQPMTHGTVELVAGVVHDPLFGSLVMVGLGGVHTELFGDRALRLLPLTDLDAGRMWRSLRAAPLLTGYRGEPGVDTAAVEDLLVRLGRLAEDLPEIAELDLNPVLAGPLGLVAVDVKLRLAAVGTEPDQALRALREPA
jgi:acyl-CoA synthetase (NDP forming)/GNAT superfamily N-acetyltransferase